MSFVDHFPGSSVDSAIWGQVTGGSGTVSVANSQVTTNKPSSTDVAYIYHKTPIDITKDWLYQICGAITGSSGDRQCFLIYQNSTPGTAEAQDLTSIACRIQMPFHSPNYYTQLEYWNTGGTRTKWNPNTAAWTTGSDPTVAQMRNDLSNYYVVGIENDGVNERFRLMSWVWIGSGTYTNNQGLTLVQQSDWVDWADLQVTSSDLYLFLNNPWNSGSAQSDIHTEWVRFADGDKVHAWVNQRATVGNYNIRHCWSMDNEVFVPEDLTTTIGTALKDPFVIYDPSSGYYHLFGYHEVATLGIFHYTATDPNGPWTANGSNPIIGVPSGESAGNYAPFVVVDLDEPDSNARWKILFGTTGSGVNHIYYAESPAPTGTPPTSWSWSTPTQELSSQSGAEGNGVSNPSPVWYGSQWEVWYGAIADSSYDPLTPGWRTFRAVGTLDAFSRDGAGIQIDIQRVHQVITGISGRTLTVPDTTGFEVDAPVILTDNNTNTDFNISRIRALTGTTIELYHECPGFTAGSVSSIRNGSYQWTASGSGTNEYYLEASGGGSPGISKPGTVLENSLYLRYWDSLGSLHASEWGWGDNDSLGFNTVYIRLTDGADPDSKATDFVQYAASTAPVIRQFNYGSVYPKTIKKLDDGRWVMYTTPFGFMRDTDQYNSVCEQTGLFEHSASAPDGDTFAPNWLATPCLGLDEVNGDISEENLNTLAFPIRTSELLQRNPVVHQHFPIGLLDI